jgi:hypothetical protein
MRLPKPIATGVKYQSRALGSVYTAAQMKAYAAKAVEAEREDMAEYAAVLAEAGWSAGSIADALRARGSK